MTYTPIVTVVVLSYNSANTIKETLNSIYQQDYNNIELIITDDGSSDESVEICKAWVAEKSERFRSVKVLYGEENKGTTYSCNRAINTSTGEWVSIMGADDIMYPNCVSSYVRFAYNNPEASWIIPKFHTYINTFEEKNILHIEDNKFTTEWKALFNLNAQEQFKVLIRYNFICAPNEFRKKTSFEISGVYNTKYGLLEDYSMNLQATKKGLKCYLIDEFLYGYRRGESNVVANTVKLFNLRYDKNRIDLLEDYCFEYYKWNEKAYKRLWYYIHVIFDYLNMNNSRNFFFMFLYRSINVFLKIVFFVN